jgi:hypothetical protein
LIYDVRITIHIAENRAIISLENFAECSYQIFGFKVILKLTCLRFYSKKGLRNTIFENTIECMENHLLLSLSLPQFRKAVLLEP